MNVNIRQIFGPWALGYTLDKHSVRSTFIGHNEFGHPEFDTLRTQVGEALFQLKYRFDVSKAGVLADQIVASFWRFFSTTSFIVPMPSSKARAVQPVAAISREVAIRMGLRSVESLLLKHSPTPQMKDIALKQHRDAALASVFSVSDVLPDGSHDVLLIDDLYDTGSSLAAATRALQQYPKIRRVFVAAVTRKRP
jgi:predicted amidophosphoribosyltransferase